MGLLQATITEPQSQSQPRTAPGTPDQAAPATGGEESSFPWFLCLSTALPYPQADKMSNCWQSLERRARDQLRERL